MNLKQKNKLSETINIQSKRQQETIKQEQESILNETINVSE
jgi:hypothetical protein